MSGERLTTEGELPLEELFWLGKDLNPNRRLFCRMTRRPNSLGESDWAFTASPSIINLIKSYCGVEGYARVEEPFPDFIVLDYDPCHKDIGTKIKAVLNSLGSLSPFSP